MPDCPSAMQLQHTTELADLKARIEAIEGRIPTYQDNDRSLAIMSTVVARLEKTLEKFNGTMNRVDENLISLNTRTSNLESSQTSIIGTVKGIQDQLKESEEKNKVDTRDVIKKIFTDLVPKIVTILIALGGIVYGILKATKVLP